ncbi:MAG: DUF3488 and transglutaminase-like domain-containing protein [Planctomycetota bacterium]
MNPWLRFSLVGLVFTNLCFAWTTEAASWSWLGPFMLLTLASPWLAGWAEFLWYRAAWNAAVLGGFALLVHHITTAGVAYLLEDGLLLATLAQVHLLNNIGRMQKPDLLFFNSFLIAIVTSFLSVDVGYSIVFLVYAPCLLLALQMHAQRGQSSRVALQGFGPRVAAVIGLTLAIFFLMPRDFQRRGYFAETMRLNNPGLAEVDFSDRVNLQELNGATASNRVVMRVHLRRGRAEQVPQHWRGATLDRFDGSAWSPGPEGRVLVRSQWKRSRRAGVWVRPGESDPAWVEVVRLGDTRRRFPMPLSAQAVHVVDPQERMTVRAARDLTFRSATEAPTRCEIAVQPERVDLDALGGRAQGDINTHVALDRRVVPSSARTLAATLRAQAPDLESYVQRVAHHLRTQHVYLPPGAEDGASSLDEFLSGRKGGHCEYFASAMVVLLRMQFVPCRLVTGYRSDEWTPDGKTMLLRARHAHAWVEVYDAKRGWTTIDPTPASDSPEAVARLNAWMRLRYWMAGLWEKVTGFDRGARAALTAWLTRPATRAGLAGLAVALIAFRRWRRRRPRVAAAVRRYERTLARFDVTLREGETPRELLGRVELEPAQHAELEEVTEAHEEARYATSPMSVEPALTSSG